MTTLVDLIVLLGMLVVLPLGLTLLDGPAARLARWWPLLAAPGAVSLWLPRGPLATALAACYAAATGALAALALHRAAALRPATVLRRAAVPPGATAPRRAGGTAGLSRELAAITALAAPSVAGLALVAERSGHRLLGFDLDILALTVPHFHFAGFTAALVAGLVRRAAPDRGAARWAALSVPAGTLLVLAGYFVDDWAELLGALVLTAGMWLVGLTTWRDLRHRAPDRLTAGLLAVSSAVLALTMLLALWWAAGEATGLPHPTLTWMAATHGLGNALGFALCAVLAWRRLAPRLENPA